MRNRRIAVIGSGVAGLTAAYVLARRDHVVLFEADGRLGGHAHTHEVDSGDGRSVPVDSGFLVHNERTYPLLTRLFDELGVATRDSEMSMSVRCLGCGLEYAGARGLRGLLTRPGSLLRGRYLRMLAEVPRFHAEARRLLEREPGASEPTGGATLGDFLRSRRFSPYFVSHFITPLVAAVWSCPGATAQEYPARYLFRFLANHGMLSITGSPQWQTVAGGSREYVERVAKGLPEVRTGVPVRGVRRTGEAGEGVEVRTDDDEVQHYAAAVIATHPDQALRMRSDAGPLEREVLGAFTYARNPAVLHTDTSWLPRADSARASWNHLMPSCGATGAGVQVSYHLNRLHRLDVPRDYVVTLNGADRIPDERVHARMDYEHPVYTVESVSAQGRLPELNDHVLAYAGAYHGWGFHEDGCRSGLRAAESLGGQW